MGIAGLIMKALGWQVVGAGMVAKSAYDTHKSNQAFRAKEQGYARAAEWWNRYGIGHMSSDNFAINYAKGINRDFVLAELREKIHTDIPYVNYLINTGGTNCMERQDVCIIYQALHGRALRLDLDFQKFPMAGRFDYRHPEIKEFLYQLFRNAGVPDSDKWFVESKQKQCALLGVSQFDY